jgi:hypothetical protein
LEQLIDSTGYWPGELPAPEVVGLVSCFFAMLCLMSAGLLRILTLRYPMLLSPSRRLATLGLLSILLLGPCAVGLLWRNYDMRVLKRFLQERTVVLRAFQASHSDLNDDQVVIDFYRTDPGPWTFRFDEQHTYVEVYPTRTNDGVYFAVNFGGRGADIAVFDPDTMIVLNSY